MKVLPFTIPGSHDRTLLVQEDKMKYFYPHLHRHEEIQLTLILQGEGSLLVGNTIHPFRENEIYLIGADLPHVFKSDASYFAPDSQQEVHAITIFFNPKGKLASLFELPELKNMGSFFTTNYTGFRIPESSLMTISSSILAVKDSEGVDQFILFFNLLKALASISDTEPLVKVDPPKKNISDFDGMRISNVYTYILQHYHTDLTLDEVAGAAYMTPQAFCRYFKKHTRVTFIAFLNEIRVNEACKKLIDGKYSSISSVAYDCGFNSITNFNRVFRSITGKSPRKFTSLYLNNVN